MDATLAYTRLSLGSLTTTLSVILWDPNTTLVTAMVLGLLVSLVGVAMHTLIPHALLSQRAVLWFAASAGVLAAIGSTGILIPPTALFSCAAANGLVQALLPATVALDV